MINKNLNLEIGRRLKKCREEKHYTQKDLAEYCFCTPQTISYIENGKRGLSRDIAHRIADILHIREEYLLCESSFKTSEEEWKTYEKLVDISDTAVMQYLHSLGHNISLNIQENEVRELIDYCSKNGLDTNKQEIHFTTYSNDISITISGKTVIAHDVSVVIDNNTEIALIDYLDIINDLNDYASFLLSQAKERKNRRLYHIAVNAVEDERKKSKSLLSPEEIIRLLDGHLV